MQITQTPQYMFPLPVDFYTRWQSMSAEEIIDDPAYVQAVRTLDVRLLERTLASARHSYEAVLPYFQDELKRRFGVARAPMFSNTLGSWLLSAIEMPHYLHREILS